MTTPMKAYIPAQTKDLIRLFRYSILRWKVKLRYSKNTRHVGRKGRIKKCNINAKYLIRGGIVDKWTQRSAIIGGTWGLLSGMIYAWMAFAAGFSGHSDIGALFKNIPIIWKIIFLPAFVTDMFSYLLGNSLIIIASFLGFYFFILWCIGISILFGITISLSIAAVIKKRGVIKLRKIALDCF